MGMEVRGRKPESEAGVVFQATEREWAIVHEATRIVCEMVLEGTTFEALRGPGGGGSLDAALCSQLAARLLSWMSRERFDGLDDLLAMVYVALRLRKPAWPQSAVPTDVIRGRDVRRLFERWVSFLSHCGGCWVS